LGESAFRSCESLRSICIPSSVETIYYPFCFSECVYFLEIVFEVGCKLSAEAVSDLRSNYRVTLQ
jgi:hypothetical protein